jgi:hypothetical protein
MIYLEDNQPITQHKHERMSNTCNTKIPDGDPGAHEG